MKGPLAKRLLSAALRLGWYHPSWEGPVTGAAGTGPIVPSALPPPSPGPAANSPRPSGPPIGPARVLASAEASESEASNRGGADPAARGVPSPPPVELGKGPPASAPPNWPKLIGDIKDALPSGPERVRAVISEGLPKYDKKTTYGVLITNEGDVVPLQSADAIPLYKKYIPASHVEGKAAIWLGDYGSSGGAVYHNNTDGTCGWCNSMLRTLLPNKVNLKVFPPQDAVAKDSWARQNPTEYEGNAAIPKPPPSDPQGDLFNRQQR